jgi:flagellar FliL protein
MKGKKIFVVILIVLITVAAASSSVYFYMRQDSEEKKIETVIVSLGDKFQTNLKDSRSIISINLQVEVQKDKKLLLTLQERNPEIRSRVLDILRDKTAEDVNGTLGKQSLEKQILQYLQASFGKDRVVSVFIDDIVVQ